MAEALVSVILKQLVSITTQEIEQEVRLVVGVEKEVKKLTSNLQTIKAVLNDAEKRQVTEEAVELWLDKLKDTSSDMENVLNEWSTALLKLQIEGVDKAPVPKKKVCSFIPSPCSCFGQVNKLALRHDIAHNIKDLNKTVDEIAKERQMYGFESNSGPEEIEQPKTTSLIDVSNIRGRDKDKVDLVNNLLGKGSREERSPHIHSLIGMGGIGKTTLAQLAYNDDEVKAHFEIKMWVCVSDPFDQIKVAKAIIQEAKGVSTNIIELETLLQSICNLVEGKKFFLVLDDVWTEDEKKWEPFKLALTDGSIGSRILITTRKEKVAVMVGSVCKFNLGILSEEDCWLMFSKIAFSEKNEEQCKDLEDLGRQIACKCNGLPLAAKTLGSLMRYKKTIEQWKDVLHSRVWELEEAEKDLFVPLWLSYFDLPSPIKRCFTFCAIFPKGYMFDREKMVRLWMAQGYLDSKRNMEMEITGREYFEMLAMRSFFQDFKIDEDGSITECKMHDIMHDHAQSLMKNVCFQVIVGVDKEFETNLKVRHLTLRCGKQMEFPTFVYKAQNLSTLLLFGRKINYQIVLPNLFLQLACLKTLILSSHSIKEVPREVERLIHLRYLDLSGNDELKELPEMICSLCNLQTLDVSYTNIDKLPKGIGRLIKLRHLIREWKVITKPFPKGFGGLTSLRALEQFVAYGNEDSEGCKLGELKNLNHLRGEFAIQGLGNLIEVREAENAQLKKKIHLRKLRLYFNGRKCEENRRTENDELLLNALEPHPDLEDLFIENYKGTTMFRNWLMSIKLKRLDLAFCNKLEFLPHLGRLPFLESLNIVEVRSVKKVGVEFLGIESKYKKKDKELASSSSSLIFFPNLISLNFGGFKEWEEWDGIEGMIEEGDSVTIMPRLHSLSIIDCPRLKTLPHFLHETPLQDFSIFECQILSQRCEKGIGEEWPKISHIPNITSRYLSTSLKELDSGDEITTSKILEMVDLFQEIEDG